MARVQGSQECGYWLQVRSLKCSADHLTLQDKTLRWLIPVKNEPYLKTVKVYVFLLLRIILYYKPEVYEHDVPIGFFGIFLDVLGSCLVCFVHSVIWVGNTFFMWGINPVATSTACCTAAIDIWEQFINTWFFFFWNIVHLRRSKFDGILAVGIPSFY